MTRFKSTALSLLSAIYFASQFPKEPSTAVKKPANKVTAPADIHLTLVIVAVVASVGWAIRPSLYSPVLPHPLSESYHHPDYPLVIHSIKESVTGLISVGEILSPSDPSNEPAVHSVRFLRAAHSLLGGVWTGDRLRVIDNVPPLKDVNGTPLGDSIYGVFNIQEAARLVNSTGARSIDRNVLVM